MSLWRSWETCHPTHKLHMKIFQFLQIFILSCYYHCVFKIRIGHNHIPISAPFMPSIQDLTKMDSSWGVQVGFMESHDQEEQENGEK